jgi:hypothetical protein
MPPIDRESINTDIIHITLLLNLLLIGIVMHMTKRLQFAKPKQLFITMMRDDMIGNVSSLNKTMLLAHAAQGLSQQLLLGHVAPALFSIEVPVLVISSVLAHGSPPL